MSTTNASGDGELSKSLSTAYDLYGRQRRMLLSKTVYVTVGGITASYNGRNFVLYLDAKRDRPNFGNVDVALVCTTSTSRAWSVPFAYRDGSGVERLNKHSATG